MTTATGPEGPRQPALRLPGEGQRGHGGAQGGRGGFCKVAAASGEAPAGQPLWLS